MQMTELKLYIAIEFDKTMSHLKKNPDLSAAEVKQEIGALRLKVETLLDDKLTGRR